MAFLGAIKGLFDKGGVKVKLEVPKHFTWADGHIPVVVELTGDKNDARTVELFEFSVIDDETHPSDRDRESGERKYPAGNRVSLGWNLPGPVEVPAQQVVRQEVSVPLPAGGVPVEGMPEIPGIGRLLLNLVHASPETIPTFHVTVKVHVAGYKRPTSRGRGIQQAGTGGGFLPRLSF